MARILETDVGFHHAPGALDVDVIETVDQDVTDAGVLEQRLERTQAEHFVQDLLDDALTLGQRHGDAFVPHQPLYHAADLDADALLVQRPELLRVERAEQLVMNLALYLKPAIGARAGP